MLLNCNKLEIELFVVGIIEIIWNSGEIKLLLDKIDL